MRLHSSALFTRHALFPHFLFTLLLAFFFRDILFLKATAAIHDTLKVFPFFHYLVQNVQNGVFPLWSPQGHSGEPFWPYLLFTGLLQPLALVALGFAWVTQTEEIALLFHWFLFLSMLVFNWGTALVIDWLFRASKHRRGLNWIMSPLIFFGTFSAVVWAQIFGTVLIAAYYPLGVYLLLRTFDSFQRGDRRSGLKMASLLAVVLAIHITSYNPVFFCTAFAIQTLALLARGLWDSREKRRLVSGLAAVGAFTIVLAALFAAPTWVLAERQSLLAPVARQDDAHYYSEAATYNAGFDTVNKRIHGDLGDSALLEDVFQSLQGNAVWDHKELPLVVGIAGFFLICIGFARVRNPIQTAFGLPLLVLVLVSLGSKVGLSTLLYNSIPGFTLARHLQFFLVFAFFGAAITAALGCEQVLTWAERISRGRTGAHLFLSMFLFAIVLAGSLSEFRRTKTLNLQPIPEILTAKYAYLGKSFSWRRRFQVDRVQPLAYFRDHTQSQGEPFLLFEDSVRFLGRQGPKFFAPYTYWKGLSKQTFTLDQLGVSADKLRLLGPGGQITVTDYSPNAIKMQVSTTVPQTLFYSQNQFPGWRAKMDGQAFSIPSFSSHPFFEFTVPPGTHTLELTYRPRKFIAALALYFSGLIFSAGLAFASNEAIVSLREKSLGKKRLLPQLVDRVA